MIRETDEKQPESEREDPARESAEEPAMCFCPVCSTRLGSFRCKLICERCGYFMSCADYY